MPTTPGNAQGPDAREPPELPGAIEEKKQLVDMAGSHLPIEPLDLPSVRQVARGFEDCSIAHFACHGCSDRLDPSDSGLILQRCEGGQTVQDRLTVRRVSEPTLQNARVAYLLACSTAENKAGRLSDEVIHVITLPASITSEDRCILDAFAALNVRIAVGGAFSRG
ncbi:hypothetical protein DL767_009793 [Monosporascus sp. MG133]|nr:hypothetical protein DL767_009793 [Monosporascus sp. MG133]